MQSAVALVDATYDLLAAASDHQNISRLLGAEIAEGWLDFPEVLPKTLADYAGDRGPKRWGTLLFLLAVPRTLIGWGGFKGPPAAEGVVEIGYAIAPAFRGQGRASAAARLMVDRAFADAAVTAIAAHTLAEVNASTAVLRKLGFRRIAEIVDPEDGPIWRWRLLRASSVP